VGGKVALGGAAVDGETVLVRITAVRRKRPNGEVRVDEGFAKIVGAVRKVPRKKTGEKKSPQVDR
jgi:hypothetical protein